MTIDEIVEYVTKTPDNANPAVLHDMLEQLSGGGSVDNLYTVIFRGTQMDMSDLTCDQTYDEVLAAAMAGKIIISQAIITPMAGTVGISQGLLTTAANAWYSYIEFSSVSKYSEDTIEINIVHLNIDNTIDTTQMHMSSPAVN